MKKEIKNNEFDNTKLNVGWVGSKSTTKYIEELISIVEDVEELSDVQFYVVGAELSKEYENCISLPWTSKNELYILQNSDLGVMPLWSGKRERYKCAFKLIQYIGMGIPAISSSYGYNRYLCNLSYSIGVRTKQWLDSIKKALILKRPENWSYGLKA